MKLARAQHIADKVLAALAPFCAQITIAGSIRRQRPEVGDIDIVCEPYNAQAQHDLIARCLVTGRCTKAGEQYRVFTLQDETQLDLWFAHAGDTDLLGKSTPANFATLLVCRTGSKEFNISLAQQAKARGLHWNPHAGLMRPTGRAFVDGRGPNGKRFGHSVLLGDFLETPTEGAFFKALGLDYIKPEDREV